MGEELKEKAGKKYQREKRFSKWGNNLGSTRIGEEKVPVEVLRFYVKEEEKIAEAVNYRRLHKIPMPLEEMVQKVVWGLSHKDYERVTQSVLESFGMSQSTVSQAFVQARKKYLRSLIAAT